MPRRRTPSPRRKAPPRRLPRDPRLVALVAGLVALGWLAVRAHEAGWVDLGGLYAVLTAQEETPRPTVASPEPGGAPGASGALRFVTWNIANLGGSKDEAEIGVMADVLTEVRADLVAVQEVITSAPGEAAVRRPAAALEARDGQWAVAVSDATTGRASERYAYLWRTDRVVPQGSFWLDPTLADTFDREPFMGRFALRGSGAPPILVASYHAPPTGRDPERELTRLPALVRTYADDILLISGDFNLDAQRAPFDGLRAEGFRAALPAGERTTLKAVASPSGERLASAYDNVFYRPEQIRVAEARAVDFSPRLPTLRAARDVSDHLPVLVILAPP